MTDVVDVVAEDVVPIPPPTEELNPISCELCRQRKIKCSRTLPTCNDCARLNYPCKYPERAKRGPPTGYIDSLERRLAQTEAALYNVLSTLPGIDADAAPQVQRSPDEIYDRFDKHSATLVRTERMATWARLPLDVDGGNQRWWREAHDRIIAPEKLPPPPRQSQKSAANAEDARSLPAMLRESLGPPTYSMPAKAQPPSQARPEVFPQLAQEETPGQSQPPEPVVQSDVGLSASQATAAGDDPMVDPALSHDEANLSLASAANEAVNNMNGKRALEDSVVDFGQRPNPSRKYF